MAPLRSRQGGVSGAAIFVAILLIGAALVLGQLLTRTQASTQGEKATRERMTRISDALVQFAVVNSRLPCPALGTDDAGASAPAAPNATCTDSAGVVPWNALGLRRDDAIDGWGRKVSYRVYSGATGFTQANGVNATDCNSDLLTPLQATLAAGGLCSTYHWNTPAQFITGKGLTVNEQGTNRTGLAFVLISHGETGYGGYVAEGATARTLMPTGGGNEAANAAGASPFYSNTHSAVDIAATNAAFFDDVVLFRTQDEVISAAKLGARKWGTEFGVAGSQTFDRTSLTTAGLAATNNTGVGSFTFGTGAAAITAQAFGSGARNISSGVGTSGEGIGSIGGGSTASANTTLNSGSGEFLRFTFATSGRSLGITVVDFGTSSGQFEQVRLTFYSGSTPVGSAITKVACHTGAVQANFSVSPGADFNRVDVEPRNTAGGFNTTMLVGSLRTCTSVIPTAQCTAPTADAVNDCP